MSILGILGSLFFAFSLIASEGKTYLTQIEDIDYGHSPQDEVLIFLSNGKVAKWRNSYKALQTFSLIKNFKKKWYQLTLGWDRTILEIKEINNANKILSPTTEDSFFAPMSYLPTTVERMELVRAYHRRARYHPKESQCFNRAMVWVYEWWRNHSLKSNKLFLFFSRTYIRRYNFEWWFHVAPYVHVMEKDKVVERVLDIKYSRVPRKFQDWANIFLHNNAPCSVITKYSDYADFPYSGECFFQRTHMYTYRPADLQMYEAWGYSKEKFNMDEVRAAYMEAFNEKI